LIQLVLVGGLLSGCATTKGPVTFSAEAAKQIKTVDLCIGLTQQEIYAEIEKSMVSMYTGGGLIPALIDVAVDNHRTKKAESSILPLRDGLAGYDFPKTFETAMCQRLETAGWMELDKVTVTNVVSKESFEQKLSGSGAQSVLFVTCRYFLDPDLNTVNISADTELLPTPKLGAPKDSSDKALYRSTVAYKKSTDAKMSGEDAVKYWANNNGTRIREALDEGIKIVTNKIASEMRIDNASADKSSPEKVE
jgi:hypothetical protein